MTALEFLKTKDEHFSLLHNTNASFSLIEWMDHMEEYAEHRVTKFALDHVGESFYYRFVYHDENGEKGYTIIKIDEDCHDLAQIEFDRKHPNKRAYRSEKVTE